MRRFLAGLAVAAAVVIVTGAIARGQQSTGVNPPGNERRSMGNLRYEAPRVNPAPQPGTRSDGFTHRRYSYGNPPYYRRPPVSPYYVLPYGYNPYWDRGYGYYVVPWGSRPYYVPPAYNPYWSYPYYRY